MEDEIKVGEYVRTHEGYIAKFKKYEKSRSSKCKLCIFDNSIRDISYIIYDEDTFLFDDELKKYIAKHSPNIIDLIEDEDFCKIEFYSPRYEKRVTRIFKVSKIDEYINFENFHCDLFMVNREWSLHDKRLNPVIKEVVTKEMMESISYKVERKD